METRFASPERDDLGRVRESFAYLNTDTRWDLVLDLLPSHCLVVNRHRQIIFANRSALESLGLEAEAALGCRPGEILGCVHAHEGEGGCGTTEACGVCGAVLAMLDALAGKRNSRECRILARRGDGLESLDMRVTGIPIAGPAGSTGGPFALLALEDVSDQKRRQVLERLFFHDIMNSLASIQAAVTLIGEELDPKAGTHAFMEHLRAATDNLVDEVRQQREIVTMESGDLTVNTEEVDIAGLLEELAAQVALAPWAQERNLELALAEDMAPIQTDPVLLRRVVLNMLKNAFESAAEEDTVTLAAAPARGGIEIAVNNPAIMPADVQLQVFQRSFSTKGLGRGIGTWSMKILGEDYLGGRVGFESRAGEGTTFRIWLPMGRQS